MLVMCYLGNVDYVQKPGQVHVKHHRRTVKFSDAWAGQHVTFGKQRDTGDIFAWGLNNYFQLGTKLQLCMYCCLLLVRCEVCAISEIIIVLI